MRFITFCISFFLIGNISNAQFVEDDIKFESSGLSEENSTKFKEKLNVLIKSLNKFDLPESIKPIEIKVVFEDNQGYVRMKINFKEELIYSDNSSYSSHGKQFKAFGNGKSFFFQHQMLALSDYKFAVARNGYSVNTELAKFLSILCLKNEKGELMNI